MALQIPGFEPLAFAVPFSDYGQGRTNYAPIPAWESGWLQRTFKVFFVQDQRVYNLPGNPIGLRYGVRASTTAEMLHAWLRQALPQSAWVSPRPQRPKLRRLRVRRRSVVIVFKVRDGITLKATRRRAGRRHRVRVQVSAAAPARQAAAAGQAVHLPGGCGGRRGRPQPDAQAARAHPSAALTTPS